MGRCNYRYNCECLAYKQSGISGFAGYSNWLSVISIFENPFYCRLTADSEDCTSFSNYVDAIVTADYAVMKAFQILWTKNGDVIGAV